MLEASQILQIGPIQLPLKWIVLLSGLFLSTGITELIARKKGWEKERWSDLILTFVLIVIVIYKFGWILFNLQQVIQTPQMIIWTPGTTMSLWLGILVALLYFVLHVRKKGLQWFEVVQFSWLTFTITYFLFTLLIRDYGKSVSNPFIGIQTSDESTFYYHPVNLYMAIWLGILLFLRFGWWKNITFSNLMFLYMGLGFGMLITSLFDDSRDLIIGLTVGQWIAVVPVLIGIIGLLTKKDSTN